MNQQDPLQKQTNIDIETKGLSPMDPPDAYEPPAKNTVPYEDLHPFLKELYNDHRQFSEALNLVEHLIHKIQIEGFQKSDHAGFATFFKMLDEDVLRHHKAEELWLFPLLQRRLLEHNDHSRGNYPTTAVDMMVDDHVKIVQQSALAFNLMGLAFRLPDRASGLMTLDLALEQCKALHETMKLHIFREDHIIWGLAHKYLTPAELDDMLAKKKLFKAS